MARDTIAPRPGVEVRQTLYISFSRMTDVNQSVEANIESDINDMFVEPDQLGQIQKVFRSEVVTSGALGIDDMMVKTSTNRLEKDEVMEIINIIERRAGSSVDDWRIEGRIARKESVVDFI